MGKHITVTIDAIFGSQFQEEVLLKALTGMIQALQYSAHSHHKNNHLAYFINIEDQTNNKESKRIKKLPVKEA